jgi:hypothetical protein
MYAPKNIGSRHCFRCSLPLTDAASLNEGIGPICRKLDNSILARLLPSDMVKVLAAYQAVDPLALAPDTLDTFMTLEAALRAPDAAQREDWRKEVKRIEWMLSYGQSYANIQALKAVVLALGYVGLVSLWNGDAATGLASVFTLEGRLALTGPQNKTARIAFKKIKGWGFIHANNTGTERPVWTVPAAAFREFRLLVISFYPNFEGLGEAVQAAQTFAEEQAAKQAAIEAAELEAAKLAAIAKLAAKEAEAAKLALVAPAAPQVAPKAVPVVSIVEVGDTLKVKTPFRVSYISEIRATSKTVLPRVWNPVESVWEFPVSHKAQVEALLQKHYGIH